MTVCRSCGRPLRDAESIAAGLGPKCRRALRPGAAGGGQLALDVAAPARPRPRRRRSRIRWPRWHRDGRRITTLPDIATYQEPHPR